MQPCSINRKHFVVLISYTVACATALIFTFLPYSSLRAEDAEKPYENFNASMFDVRSADITNKWMPLSPGSRLVYSGSALDDDGKRVPHRVIIHVTNLTKVISGIRTRVTWDLDYSEGELVEAELAFFAQDKKGNVWRMGEYPEEYSDGELDDNPAWIAGVKGARAGISMQHNPRLKTPSYSQGWAPKVEFTDRGQVYQKGLEICVPVGCFGEVLAILETSDDEPEAKQFKYWARNLGNIKVGWSGEDKKNQEVLELVDFIRLTGGNLNRVHEQAFLLEKKAYKLNKDVYGVTSPMVNGGLLSPAKLSK